jgi:hypothetical protein
VGHCGHWVWNDPAPIMVVVSHRRLALTTRRSSRNDVPNPDVRLDIDGVVLFQRGVPSWPDRCRSPRRSPGRPCLPSVWLCSILLASSGTARLRMSKTIPRTSVPRPRHALRPRRGHRLPPMPGPGTEGLWVQEGLARQERERRTERLHSSRGNSARMA